MWQVNNQQLSPTGLLFLTSCTVTGQIRKVISYTSCVGQWRITAKNASLLEIFNIVVPCHMLSLCPWNVDSWLRTVFWHHRTGHVNIWHNWKLESVEFFQQCFPMSENCFRLLKSISCSNDSGSKQKEQSDVCESFRNRRFLRVASVLFM